MLAYVFGCNVVIGLLLIQNETDLLSNYLRVKISLFSHI